MTSINLTALREAAEKYEAANDEVQSVDIGTYRSGDPKFDILGRHAKAQCYWSRLMTPATVLKLVAVVEAARAFIGLAYGNDVECNTIRASDAVDKLGEALRGLEL